MRDVASAWMNAGTSTVMLPSGVQVRWEPTSVADLMVRGVLPGYLRSVAAQLYADESKPLTDDEQAKWKEMVALLIRTSVREVALPGSDEFEPYQLSAAQVNDDDPRMPRVDLEALQHLALHLRTPREVDATSRVATLYRRLDEAAERGASDDELDLLRQEIELKAGEYRRIIEKEAAHAVLGWADFRGLLRRAGNGDQRQDVGRAAVQPADHLGRGARPRPRRRTRKSAGGASQPSA
jgi:hypothetical protein